MENRMDARDRLNALSTGTKILLPAAILLLIDLFLSWQKTCIDTSVVGNICGKASGWNGFWGVLLGLLTIALIVWVGLQIAGVNLSGANLPVTDSMITLGLGVLVLAAAVIKLITILGESSTIWSYIGVILAALAAYGAWQRSREIEEAGPVTRARSHDTGSSPTSTGTTADDVPHSPGTGSGHTAGGLADDAPSGTSGPSSTGGRSGGMAGGGIAGGTTGVPPATGPAPGSGMGPDDELGTEPADTEHPRHDHRDDV